MRILPVSHLAVEVPWHDTDWDGRICRSPVDNAHCLAISAIRRLRDDLAEQNAAGRVFSHPMVNAAVASGEDDEDTLSSSVLRVSVGLGLPPCAGSSFMRATPLSITVRHPLSQLPPFSHLLPTLLRLPPWSLAVRPSWLDRAEALGEEGIADRYALRIKASEEPDSPHIEVESHQEALCESFFSAIQPETSLIFLYCRSTPLSPDRQPVLIGVARVTSVGTPIHFERSSDDTWSSLLPFRAVEHSLRPDLQDGLKLPYQTLLELLPSDPSLGDLICRVPSELLEAFKGDAALLDQDAADALLSVLKRSYRKLCGIFPDTNAAPLRWIEVQQERVRDLRGDAPGAAAALRALGVRQAPAVVAALSTQPNLLWPRIEAALSGQAPELSFLLPPSFSSLWSLLSESRRSFLKQLAAFALSPDQALRLYASRLSPSDDVLIENPWLLAEADAENPNPLSVEVLDRGMMGPPLDQRRIQAMAATALRQAAEAGHSFLPTDALLSAMAALPVDPPLQLSPEFLSACLQDAHDLVAVEGGYQLARLARHSKLIRRSLQQRSLRRLAGPQQTPDGTPLTFRKPPPDWNHALQFTMALPPALEARARAEKLAALEELYASRLTVFVAPRKTGSSTVLQALLNTLQGRVLIAPNAELLAEARLNLTVDEAWTVAHLPERRERWRCVIVMAAQALGERELARILHASAGAERIILVGDPALPLPASPGRPFVDLVNHLAPAPDIFPRVGRNYVELCTRCVRADLLRVADWFSGRPLPVGASEARDVPQRFGVRFIRWKHAEDLAARLTDALVTSLELSGVEDEDGFCSSLSQDEGSPSRHWQVLSPVRGGVAGVDALNRLLHRQFRRKGLAEAGKGGSLPAIGLEELLLYDKVVCCRSGRRVDVQPPREASALSQGELGRIIGQAPGADIAPWKLEVRFASHPKHRYGFTPEEFATDHEGPIALAYALSIRMGQLRHRLIYLVLPDNYTWTREMIYAALSHAEDRVYILHPGSPEQLFSQIQPDTARRYTRLFTERPPEDAIHLLCTRLDQLGINYVLQPCLEASDGALRWPALVFDDLLGRRVHWEHVGLPRDAHDLNPDDELVAWYQELEILTETEAPWGGSGGLLVLSHAGEDVLGRLEALLGEVG